VASQQPALFPLGPWTVLPKALQWRAATVSYSVWQPNVRNASCSATRYSLEPANTWRDWNCCFGQSPVVVRLLLSSNRRPHFKTYKWSWVPAGPETENDCAGEDQQQITALLWFGTEKWIARCAPSLGSDTEWPELLFLLAAVQHERAPRNPLSHHHHHHYSGARRALYHPGAPPPGLLDLPPATAALCSGLGYSPTWLCRMAGETGS
jgi:hypothetical protein